MNKGQYGGDDSVDTVHTAADVAMPQEASIAPIPEAVREPDFSEFTRVMENVKVPDFSAFTRVMETVKVPDFSAFTRVMENVKVPDFSAFTRVMETVKVPDSSEFTLFFEAVKGPKLEAILEKMETASNAVLLSSAIDTLSHTATDSSTIFDDEENAIIWRKTRDSVFATWEREYQEAGETVIHDLESTIGFDKFSLNKKIDRLTDIIRDLVEKDQQVPDEKRTRVINCCISIAINLLSSAIFPFCGPFAYVLTAIIIAAYCFLPGKQKVSQTRRVLKQTRMPLEGKMIVIHECRTYDSLRNHAKSVGRVEIGTLVEVQEKVSGWKRIAYFDPASGRQQNVWVRSKYLSRI